MYTAYTQEVTSIGDLGQGVTEVDHENTTLDTQGKVYVSLSEYSLSKQTILFAVRRL